MENLSNNYKQFLTTVVAAVVVVAIVVYGMVRSNETNREFEYKMVLEGYEQGSVPGMNGVFWIKKGSK